MVVSRRALRALVNHRELRPNTSRTTIGEKKQVSREGGEQG